MKIVFILLFIPLISFSQVTYKDVMSISTKNTFLKVMLDKKNYACYDCKKAKFDGLIGLTTSGKSGFITAFTE